MTTTDIETAALGALAELGFSEIEGRVYAFLLAGPPATGYRVSHAIGKPTANTYKAIAALQARGALLVDDGENKLCRAVPPTELLASLDRRFQRQREQAEEKLSQLFRPQSDDRIYQIASADQVFERARAMLDSAVSIVLLDVFPEPLEPLGASLRGALARGVRVAAKVYAPVDMPGARLVVEPQPGRVLDAWPGQQLSLVVDAEQHLLALFAPGLGEVRQAIWSPSLFLSSMHHNHLASEILLTMHDALLGPTLGAEVRAELDDARRITVLRGRPPGMERLQALYAPPTRRGTRTGPAAVETTATRRTEASQVTVAADAPAVRKAAAQIATPRRTGPQRPTKKGARR